MSKQKKKIIEVQGLEIRVEPINDTDFVSLTDIARQGDTEPFVIITSWLKNQNTLEFLSVWEKLKNPNFKPHHLVRFKEKYMNNRSSITPKRWIEEMNAVGIVSKSGRYGGTYAHKDIALEFCSWLSPAFKVYMLIEFQRLKEDEFNHKNLEWHVSKITDNVEDLRNLLDTIPGQKDKRKRLSED